MIPSYEESSTNRQNLTSVPAANSSKFKIRIDDSALQHFAEMPRLNRLELGSTLVTGSGLADLKHLKKLGRLTLSKNRNVNDNTIVPVTTFQDLTLLDLSGTSVTDTGLKLLKTALPKCQIVSPGQ